MANPRYRILVVDDDKEIRETVTGALKAAGYEVMEEVEGKAGLESALRRSYDLLLLDIEMPGKTGLDILKAIRASRPTMPVIMMTARDQTKDRVGGLELGADDYICKPFEMPEMLARIRAVLRRTPERPTVVKTIKAPGKEIELNNRQIKFDDGESADLTERETELLNYLAMHPERTITRDEILTHVYHINPRVVPGTRTVDMLVTRLRKKIRDHAEPPMIETVRGKGYIFHKPERAKVPRRK